MAKEPIKILLIEDDPADADLLQEILFEKNRQGFQLEWASRLQTGLERLAQGGIDIVLSDLSLPDSHNLETFTKIYAQVPGIPIVVMSGLDDETVAVEAVQSGAQDYLVKGEVDRNLLVRALRYAIERKRAEEALRISEERYALAARGANDGLWDWDLKRNHFYFSPRWKAMLGYEGRDKFEPTPQEWFDRVHPNDLKQLQTKIEAHLTGVTSHFESEHRVRHRNGNYRWMLCRGLGIRDNNKEVYRMVGSQTDITRLKNAEKQLRYDALHDTLTGLPNRAFFLEYLEHVIKQAKNSDSYFFAVLFLDLDRFKVVNDSLGHLVGDRLLITVARRLQSSIRSNDIVARLGGDEFTILLDKLPDINTAVQITNRIQEQIALPIKIQEHEIFITASIGITTNNRNCERGEELLRDADMAMYQAKARGKARFELFDTNQHVQTLNRWQLEVDLWRAVSRHEFKIYYQPIVHLADGKISGVEALLRWQHPHRGIIGPETFIWLAEETGLIVRLGEWVLRTACAQTKYWQDVGYSSLRVAINVATRQFQDQNLPDLIAEILAETKLPASSLELEITDGVSVKNTGSNIEALNKLRAMGVQISIDDFGLGSSLDCLKSLPLDTLKIDQSFVRNMEHDSNDTAIIKAIIAMAQNLNLKVVAEGVENQKHLELLRTQNCNEVQGHLFSEPIPPETFINLLQKGGFSRVRPKV